MCVWIDPSCGRARILLLPGTIASMRAFASIGFPIDISAHCHPQTNQELDLTRGERLFVLQASAGKAWWRVCNANDKTGFVPKSYLVHLAADAGRVQAPRTAIAKRKPGSLSHDELNHVIAGTAADSAPLPDSRPATIATTAHPDGCESSSLLRSRGPLQATQSHHTVILRDATQSEVAPCESSGSDWNSNDGSRDGDRDGDGSRHHLPRVGDRAAAFGSNGGGRTSSQKTAFLVELHELCAAKTGPGGRTSHRQNGAEILVRYGFSAEAVRHELGDCGGNVIAAASNLYDHKARCGMLVKNGDSEGDTKEDTRLAAAGPKRSPPQAPPRSTFPWRRDRSRPEGLLPGNPSPHAANVQQIVRFGYSQARAAEALLDTGGSVDHALVRLVNTQALNLDCA